MLLHASLGCVVKNVNYWAKSFRLTLYGPNPGAVAWRLENCLFTAREVDAETTEFELVAFRRSPPEAAARTAWNELGKQFIYAAWLAEFHFLSDTGSWQWPSDAYLEENAKPLPDKAQKRAWQCRELEELNSDIPYVSPWRRMRQAVKSWKAQYRYLEILQGEALAEIEKRAALAGKTAAEAAQEFFNGVGASTVALPGEIDNKNPPPVTDPTDARILAWVQEDPTITDTAIGARLNISRQAANIRRRRLEEMGYTVR